MLILLATSCASVVKIPKFTSVENIIDLKPGMTYVEVVNKLGSKPYDVLFCQQEGFTMYLYKYKVIQREIDPKNIDMKGFETTGSEKYLGEMKDVWLIMDKNNVLESYVTVTGKKDGAVTLLINNTIYTISMDKGKYNLIPTTTESKEETGNFLTGKKKKK